MDDLPHMEDFADGVQLNMLVREFHDIVFDETQRTGEDTSTGKLLQFFWHFLHQKKGSNEGRILRGLIHWFCQCFDGGIKPQDKEEFHCYLDNLE